ncbi:MAG: hypothetical protein M0R80_08375 [Proteobacteria bacterium]|jgi:hypothetical protein|nr:hypothetical protein [Pseudomonadota bacterium]
MIEVTNNLKLNLLMQTCNLARKLHIFTNEHRPSEHTRIEDLHEPKGKDYAPVELCIANWTIEASGATYVPKRLYPGKRKVYGYFVTDFSENVLWAEAFPNPFCCEPDSSIEVKLKIRFY